MKSPHGSVVKSPSQDEGDMMEDDSAPRFVVRYGAVKNTWMVWDRKFRGPAKILGGLAIRFKSKEQARELRDKLTREQGE
jgi:hypothetical protein